MSIVESACRALGRSEEEIKKFLAIASEHWLEDESFSSMSPADWEKLGFPIGLKQEILKRVSEPPTSSNQQQQRRRSHLSIFESAPIAPASRKSFEHVPLSNPEILRNVRNSRNRQSLQTVQDPLEIVRQQLMRRGADTLLGISRQFKLLDRNGDGKIDKEEFLQLTSWISMVDAQGIFHLFDADSSGTITYDEFVRAVRGGLNKKRFLGATEVFKALDQDGDGYITRDEICSYFQDARNGGYQGNLVNAKKDFCKICDMDGDGRISADEWRMYYEGISANIDDDGMFLSMIRNSWKMPGSDKVMAVQFRNQNLYGEAPI